MQCFLKSKYIKSRTFNDKNRWIIKKVMVLKKLLPHLATRGTYSPGHWMCDEAWPWTNIGVPSSDVPAEVESLHMRTERHDIGCYVKLHIDVMSFTTCFHRSGCRWYHFINIQRSLLISKPGQHVRNLSLQCYTWYWWSPRDLHAWWLCQQPIHPRHHTG